MSSEAPLDEAYFHNVDHLETTEKQANKSVEGIRREQKVTTERDEFLDGIIPGVESTKQPTCSPQSSKQLKCTFSEDDMCTIYRTDGDKKEDRHHHHATLPGVALMGGGDDLEEAFLWMLMRCDGGHVVVLGASGEDGYNEWIMDLSRRNYKRAPVVSGVTTIICHHRDASELPRVLNILKDASCIFLKGGDQNLYIEYWMNTSIQRLLQDKVRVAPLGGTSAGLAVLGRYIFTAKHDTVSSENALQNPFDERVVLLGLKQSNALYYHSMFQEGESPSFLSIPFLENVLTDSHFCSRDRMGRMVAFLCRLRGEDGGGEDGGGEDGGGDGGGEDKGDDPEKEEPTTRRHLYEEHLGVCVDDATAIVLDVTTGIAVVMGKSLVNLVRLKRQDKKKNTPTTTTYRCEKDVPLTCTGIECLQLRPGDQYYFGNDRDGESGGVNENVWNDSIKLSVVDGHLFSVNPAKDYKKFENGDETAIDDTPNETTPTTTPMNPDLSKTQKLRREAILQLDNAAHTHFVKSLSNGKITLSRRGVIATATVSGGIYYFLRLMIRDFLGRYKWYKMLNAKSDRSKLFELYFLSILNAAIMSGHSAYKLLFCEEGCTKGITRMLSTSIGYFLHDFIAMKYEFINDKGMLLHHLLCLAMCGVSLQQDTGVKKFVPMVALTELSSVFLGVRWLLRELGLAKSKAYNVVLVLFGSSFFATRIVGLQSYLYKIWNDKDLVALHPLRYLLATLTGLNVYWFYKIVMMAKKQFL